MSGPLTSVLGAVDAGAVTVDEVIEHTLLSEDTVRAALEALERMGRVRAQTLTRGCPPAGCGGCASSAVAGGGCAGGPVMVGIPQRRV